MLAILLFFNYNVQPTLPEEAAPAPDLHPINRSDGETIQ